MSVCDMEASQWTESTLSAQERQQEALAQLSYEAASGVAPEQLCQDAMEAMAAALGTEYCKVLQLLPGGNELRLLAGVGWNNGLLGSAVVGAGRDSQAGFTLLSNEPVIVEDLRAESRFSGPPLLRDHGVVSGMSVIIPGPTHPWGVLGAHTKSRRRFEAHEVRFLQTIAHLLGAVIVRAQTQGELETFFRLSIDLLVIAGTDGYFKRVNPAFSELLGYSAEELLSRPFVEFVHPDDRGSTVEAISTLREGLPVRQFENRYRAADGSCRWLLWNCSVSTEKALIYAVAHDLTKRKQLELAVASERERFNSILDVLPPYVILLTPDYHVAIANREFRRRFGEPGGRHCYEFLFGRSSPCEVCETYKVLDTGKPLEWEWTGPDGRNYEIHDFPFQDTEGGQLILEMGVDVTERKHAEEKLQEASRYARSLIEASLDPLVTINREGRITDVNEATEKATGLNRESLIGTEFSQYFSERDKAREGYQQVFTAGVVRDYPLTLRHTSGRLTEVLYNASLFRNERGEVSGVFAAARDITERKRAEEALAQRAAELARSNAELQQFAYVASHDLQEPLRMVANYTQLLARRYRGKLDRDADEFIAYAVEGATRMEALIQALLTYSRVTSTAAPATRISPDRTLSVALANLTMAIQESGAVVTSDPMPDVMADEVQLMQVFQNLIGNALKFRRGEPCQIHIAGTARGKECVFGVRDNGIGIAPEHRERVFGLFQRLQARSAYPGTGMGLAICKKIVERQGGRIWLESEPGEGSTFYFTLPLAIRNGGNPE